MSKITTLLRGLALFAQVDQDEVDKLFAEYEAQAAADRAHTEQKSRKTRDKPQKSMKELRQEGLAAPIATDNKYGAHAVRSCINDTHVCAVLFN